ncbi:hypothetical protein ACJIZ3_022449 [Penstemon smallii]|uniref:Uncharacterized protein n=1 Tax=Penstemon smallii TaxID=265156 RepID=A0ABD3TP66_9LAMI
MYRSASSNRISKGHLRYHSSSSLPNVSSILRALSLEANELPVYEPLPLWEAAKKEKARAKSAEDAVHLIPLVLILCAFILWFLSNTSNF